MPDCCAHAAAGPPPLAYGLVLITGLLMSVSHCVGMCGPLLAAYSLARGRESSSRLSHALSLCVYHAGRIATYVLLGAIFALAGSAAVSAGRARPVQGWLSIAVGMAMLLLALGLLGLLPTQAWVERAWPGNAAGRALRSLAGARTRSRQLLLGVANGCLPCGPVAAMAIAAGGTGRPLTGALSMLIYGLGTLPALLLLGAGAAALPDRARRGMYRAGALVVLLAGAQLLARGLHALGSIEGWAIGPVVIW
jgi:sulfite exporter TauE/SafE